MVTSSFYCGETESSVRKGEGMETKTEDRESRLMNIRLHTVNVPYLTIGLHLSLDYADAFMITCDYNCNK